MVRKVSIEACSQESRHFSDERFKAKESVVSTLQVLFVGGVHSALTTLSAASLLVFCLIYSPCVAAIASIKRELGARWAIGVVAWQCVLAWILAFIVHVIGSVL